jgi:serine/threonine protein kinase
MYGRKVSDYHAVDMYALGVIFWELLHPRSTFAISWRHANALPQLELDPLPDPLIKLLTDMLSRVPSSRPSANDVSLELDRLLYDGLGEIMDELELEDRFSGRVLVRSLLSHGIVSSEIEGSRVGQYLLTNLVIRPMRGRSATPQVDLEFEVRFEDSDLHFSLDQTYTLRAPSTIASPSLDWGDMEDHLSRAGSRAASIAESEQEPMTVEL